jgi:hypothetical protein
VYSKNNMETMSEIGEKAERIGPSGPVFTLGTANSASSVAFYPRISGIRENPLKYLDPDGETRVKANDTLGTFAHYAIFGDVRPI